MEMARNSPRPTPHSPQPWSGAEENIRHLSVEGHPAKYPAGPLTTVTVADREGGRDTTPPRCSPGARGEPGSPWQAAGPASHPPGTTSDSAPGAPTRVRIGGEPVVLLPLMGLSVLGFPLLFQVCKALL